ncbi:putative GPI anchored protein [Aspergillus mulundensis]|uniref:Extracellular membrane protein CFEM domain-containing protein n=1 Tax=Aspergillus mulundensis TaxID=1810919 RepID=A0A3D8T2Q1_9EURO|nr:hypothetical protein DSM5745_00167 [Aspergillus mulundensis]RDW92845.1 hypothetical protein DSM5745_00167 [Aspergillus mulundensis]
MRLQQLFTVSSFILAGNVAFGADLDRNDLPSDCHSACDPLVSISQRCDRQSDDDADEARCICDADDAQTIIPRCEACIAQYRSDHPQDNDNDGDDNDDDDDDNNDTGPHDNDAYDMLTACNLQTTSYQPSSSGGSSSSSGGGGGSRRFVQRTSSAHHSSSRRPSSSGHRSSSARPSSSGRTSSTPTHSPTHIDDDDDLDFPDPTD